MGEGEGGGEKGGGGGKRGGPGGQRETDGNLHQRRVAVSVQ